MYTNAGILAMLPVKDVVANLNEAKQILAAVEAGEIQISEQEFDGIVRWEEDMKAYFIDKTEKWGMTNVCNNVMKCL